MLSLLDKESFKVLGFLDLVLFWFFKAVQHFSKIDYIRINLAGLLEEINEECKEDTKRDERVYLILG